MSSSKSSLKKLEQYRQFLAIDKLSLDEELIEQPQVFFDVAEQTTLAADVRDQLKADLAVLDAELDKEIRLKHREEKFTEAQVKAAIQTHNRRKKANEDFLEAKQLASSWEALKESFHQRRYMLQELCGLFIANYFEKSSVQGVAPSDVTYTVRRQKLAAARRRNRMES